MKVVIPEGKCWTLGTTKGACFEALCPFLIADRLFPLPALFCRACRTTLMMDARQDAIRDPQCPIVGPITIEMEVRENEVGG